MFLHITTLFIASFFSIGISSNDPIELIPVDAGVEDRGSISGVFEGRANKLTTESIF